MLTNQRHALPVAEVRAFEVDDFNVGLPRMSAALRRAGPGESPTSLRLRSYPSLVTGHIAMAYSKIGHVDTDSTVVTVVTARRAPSGSKWNEVELAPGDTAIYPGGGHHEAVDLAGMDVGFVVVDEHALNRAIDDLGRDALPIHQGFLRGDHSAAFRQAYDRSAFSPDPADLLRVVATVVSTPGALRGSGSSRRMSSERIVRVAVRHVDDHGLWRPSSMELCRWTGVSERRLQLAFLDVYDRTPSQFFKLRALSEARRRLVRAQASDAPVTAVASDLGFHHLGRFARSFHDLFGVSPRDVAARTTSTSGPLAAG